MNKQPLTENAKTVLRMGLQQITTTGLRRLRKHVKDGKPLLLDGGIYCADNGHG